MAAAAAAAAAANPSDVQVDAPKEYEMNTDPSWFANVNPNNVAIVMKQRGDKQMIEVTRADSDGKMFSIKAPPLEAVYPRCAGEGNFGGKFTKTRDDAKFELTMQRSLAGMDDELRDIDPTLAEQQEVFFRKVHQVGRNILGAVYDKAPKDYVRHIKAAKERVQQRQLAVEEGKKSGISTVAHLERAMEEDAELKKTVEGKYREEFINGASWVFPNPDEFDETGCKVVTNDDGSSKTLHMQLKCKRKVYRYKKGKNKDTAKALPTQKDKVDPADWPTHMASIKDHEYNPFTWMDPIGGEADAQGNAKPGIIERPKYRPGGKGDLVDDPFWDPFYGQLSIVSTSVLFGVATVGKDYGISAKPFGKVFIWRQKDRPQSDGTVGYNTKLGGGFKKRERRENDDAEGASSSAAAAAAAAAPSPKRAKTEGAAAAAAAAAAADEEDDEMRAAVD